MELVSSFPETVLFLIGHGKQLISGGFVNDASTHDIRRPESCHDSCQLTSVAVNFGGQIKSFFIVELFADESGQEIDVALQ